MRLQSENGLNIKRKQNSHLYKPFIYKLVKIVCNQNTIMTYITRVLYYCRAIITCVLKANKIKNLLSYIFQYYSYIKVVVSFLFRLHAIDYLKTILI